MNNASVVGWRAQEGQAHYAAAKAGVMALTRCAAIEAGAPNVRVNAVAPSLAMHPFLAKVTTEELLAELTTKEAFGRAAEPWEVANVIVFLASDLASYLTGEVALRQQPAPVADRFRHQIVPLRRPVGSYVLSDPAPRPCARTLERQRSRVSNVSLDGVGRRRGRRGARRRRGRRRWRR